MACLTSGDPAPERPPKCGQDRPEESCRCLRVPGERGRLGSRRCPFSTENHQTCWATRWGQRGRHVDLLRYPHPYPSHSPGRRETSQRDRNANCGFSPHNASAWLVTWYYFLSDEPRPCSPLVEMALLTPPPLLLAPAPARLSHNAFSTLAPKLRAPRSCSPPAP